jgi:hypothetical protein
MLQERRGIIDAKAWRRHPGLRTPRAPDFEPDCSAYEGVQRRSYKPVRASFVARPQSNDLVDFGEAIQPDISRPAWWAPNGVAAIPTTAIDPPRSAASPAVPGLTHVGAQVPPTAATASALTARGAGRGLLLCTTWISPVPSPQRGQDWTRNGGHVWMRIDSPWRQ